MARGTGKHPGLWATDYDTVDLAAFRLEARFQSDGVKARNSDLSSPKRSLPPPTRNQASETT